MLMRSEPFTEVNRIAQQLFGAPSTGTWSRPTAMPVDAYRNGDEFVIAFDLPGVDADAIDIDVERNVLTVRAERRPINLGEQATVQLSERPLGVFSRQLFLGDALDTDRIDAAYNNGVLVIRIPVAERAKPRKIAVTARASAEPVAVASRETAARENPAREYAARENTGREGAAQKVITEQRESADQKMITGQGANTERKVITG